jgi:hypothetical protein
MWKLAIGFVVFAVLAVWMLMKGGDIDMSGEKHGTEAVQAAPAAATAATAPAPAAAAPAAPAAQEEAKK